MSGDAAQAPAMQSHSWLPLHLKIKHVNRASARLLVWKFEPNGQRTMHKLCDMVSAVAMVMVALAPPIVIIFFKFQPLPFFLIKVVFPDLYNAPCWASPVVYEDSGVC